MDIHGSGALPKLFVNATGWVATAGLGWAGEVALTGGWILKVGRRFRAKSGVSVPSVDYAVESKSAGRLHFALGDAFLSDEGRQLLRVFCACELACLESEGSTLEVDGHADRIDAAERNDELSLLRAKNVVIALSDILGSRLGVPGNRIVARGLGERRAAERGDPDGSMNPNYRKVEIVLDGRLSVTLDGG